MLRLETNLDWLRLQQETIELVAAAFETLCFYKETPIAECKELVGQYTELMLDVSGVANHLSELRAYNEYTFRHSLNVAIISGLIGKWLGYTGRMLKDLILTGLLHDIGKTLVPLAIINTPGKITAKQMDVVKQHSCHGYELVKKLKHISGEVKFGILQHHERLDGSGYPFGLDKNKITPFARIIAIADMYDAMTHARVYRPKMSPVVAMETLIGDMHHNKLDSDICKVFLNKNTELFDK